MRKQLFVGMSFLVVLSLAAACAAPAPQAPAPTAQVTAVAPAKQYKFAAILPGVITDAEYRREMVEHNYELGRAFFSYSVLRRKLRSLVTNFTGLDDL